jgi:hypothetical protein
MGFGGMATLAWIQGRQTSPAADATRLAEYRKNRLYVPSPWQQGHLTQLPFSDIFGAAGTLITRDQAMTIPGVARGRGIILSLIADKPLVDYAGSDRSDPQPKWLYRSPGWQGPWRRMANILDDHIFYGISAIATKRGAVSSGIRPILDASHIPFDDWEIDEAGRVCLLDEDGHFVPADENDVILIPGPSEGLLATATRTLTGAVELEKAWVQRAKNPIPMIELHETVPQMLLPEEAQEVVNDWATARASDTGGIAYTPNSIEARALGQYEPAMFIEARNASRLDLAAIFQLPGSLLDASTATASLTYQNAEGNLSSLDTLTVPYWARSIEDRLSQDDVVPVGHSVRFAWAAAYVEPPGPIITSPAGHPAIQDAAAIVGTALGDEAASSLIPTTPEVQA